MVTPWCCQGAAQLLAELVAQRALGQVEFVLQLRQQIEHRLFLAGLERGQRLVQPHDVDRFGAQRRGALLERGDQRRPGS